MPITESELDGFMDSVVGLIVKYKQAAADCEETNKELTARVRKDASAILELQTAVAHLRTSAEGKKRPCCVCGITATIYDESTQRFYCIEHGEETPVLPSPIHVFPKVRRCSSVEASEWLRSMGE